MNMNKNSANSAMPYSATNSATIAPECRHFDDKNRQTVAKQSLHSATDSATIALSTASGGVTVAAKMDEQEFNGSLKKHGLSRREACDLLHIKTGAVISPHHVYTQLDRYGAFGAAATAMWRLLFKQLEHEDEQRKQRTV